MQTGEKTCLSLVQELGGFSKPSASTATGVLHLEDSKGGLLCLLVVLLCQPHIFGSRLILCPVWGNSEDIKGGGRAVGRTVAFRNHG